MHYFSDFMTNQELGNPAKTPPGAIQDPFFIDQDPFYVDLSNKVLKGSNFKLAFLAM